MNIDDVFACETRLVQAQLESDVEALDRLLADDLLFVGFTGDIGTKADDLALHRSGRFKITRMELAGREARNHGAFIAVISLMDTAALFDEVPMQKRLRYTRIWTQRAQGWQVAIAHLTEVAGKS